MNLKQTLNVAIEITCERQDSLNKIKGQDCGIV